MSVATSIDVRDASRPERARAWNNRAPRARARACAVSRARRWSGRGGTPRASPRARPPPDIRRPLTCLAEQPPVAGRNIPATRNDEHAIGRGGCRRRGAARREVHVAGPISDTSGGREEALREGGRGARRGHRVPERLPRVASGSVRGPARLRETSSPPRSRSSRWACWWASALCTRRTSRTICGGSRADVEGLGRTARAVHGAVRAAGGISAVPAIPLTGRPRRSSARRRARRS